MSLEWGWLRLVKGYSSALKFSQNMNISYITNFEVLLNLLLRMLPSLFVCKVFLTWSNIYSEVFEKRHRCAVINFLFFHLDETSWIKPKLVETWCLSKRQSCCSCMFKEVIYKWGFVIEFLINPFHHNISIYILHIVHLTLSKVMISRILKPSRASLRLSLLPDNVFYLQL